MTRFLLLIALFFTLGINDSGAQLFQQDFSSSTTVSDYANATTPTNGQYNTISTSGAGTVVSINSSMLRYARTANAGSFSRTTNLTGPPTSLMYRFDITISGNSVAQTNGATFQVGSGFGTANSTESNAAVHSRVGINWTAVAGQFAVRDIVGGANSANYTGTQTITWAVNNSGATLTYLAPNGTYETVANDKADVWIGTTREFNDISATTATVALEDLKFAFSSGTATIDIDNILIDPIPGVPASSAATSITNNSFTANWSAVTGATGYRLDVATDAGFTSFVAGYNNLYVSGQATTTASITGLAANTAYYYRVRAAAQYTVGEFAGNNSTAQNPTTSAGATPTLNTSVASLTSFGNVVTGSSSAESSFTVSGDNLTSDATVTAPTGFEVSLTSGSGFSSSVNLVRSGGDLTGEPVTVYARFSPSSDNGANAGNITAASTGAVTQNVAVSGNALSTEPTTAATSVTFGTITTNTMDVHFSGGNGGRRIVVARASSAVSYVPVDAVASSGVNSSFTAASDQGSGNKIVYDGTASTVNVSGLSQGTVYHFAVYEYNVNTGASYNYKTASPATGHDNTALPLTSNPQTICNGQSYTFNGHTYTTASNYYDTLQSAEGFDSIIVTQLTVNPAYTTNNPQTICDGSAYSFNGHTYTTANTYRDTLQTFLGCDSIIVTVLTVNPRPTTNNPQTICEGSSYTINGHTYTLANTYRDTLQTFQGCDSIIVTVLTVNQRVTTNNPQTICEGSSYTINGHTYTLANTYRDTLQTFQGCDSIIVTVLTVNPRVTTNNPQTICEGSSYTINGHTYTLANTYRDTLQTFQGCDSIIVTVLTVNPRVTTNNPQTICEGSSYTINGHTYTLANTYRDTLQTFQGCDSIIVTVLTVNPRVTTNNPQTICEGSSYTINGHTYTLANTYRDTLQTFQGCDSIIVTVLTVNPRPTTNNPQTICEGSSYTINGHTYTLANTYRDTLQTFQGCDSIIVTVLTVNPRVTTNNPQTICEGSSYTINGHTYTLANTYRDTLQTFQGCDSIIVTVLTVNPRVTTNNPQTICEGSSYTINGHTYTLANTYRDTLQTFQGCDSIIVTVLTVNPRVTTNNPQTICEGSSYTINGHTYTLANTYRDTLQTFQGCDSIIVTVLTVNPKPVTSSISGNASPQRNATETYSVVNTTGSTYHWIITNGTQVSGANTSSIGVQWGSVLGNADVKVIETNTNSCVGDTTSLVVTVLPVKLISFTAKADRDNVILNWTTASELNNDHFTLSRSTDGKTFEKVAVIKGKGNSNVVNAYKYDDLSASKINHTGTLYYQLTQTDYNGTTSVPVFVTLHIVSNKASVAMYPNPAQHQLTIDLGTLPNTTEISIRNMMGETVAAYQTTNAVYQLNVSELSSGVYFVEVKNNDLTAIQKIVIQH